jgi:N-methylhydantoinase B
MDHGRYGPQGALGGDDGMPNTVTVWRDGEAYVPPHLSKDQDIAIKAGDRVDVGTPGGGGYGNPFERDPARVLQDVSYGYYTSAQAFDLFGVVLLADLSAVDVERTEKQRASRG